MHAFCRSVSQRMSPLSVNSVAVSPSISCPELSKRDMVIEPSKPDLTGDFPLCCYEFSAFAPPMHALMQYGYERQRVWQEAPSVGVLVQSKLLYKAC